MNPARGGKWLTGVQPDDPVSAAARLALEDRLLYLWATLKRAGRKGQPAVEDVHQSRVSARRAMAALETFESLAPRGRCAWMKRQVKRIRRRAGAARDDDVLLERWKQEADGAESTLPPSSQRQAAPEWWHRLLQAERAAHQAPIRLFYRKLKEARFRQRAEELVGKIRWREKTPEPTYRSAAREATAELLASLQPVLSGDMPEAEALHPLRIAGKRLRYALELFATAFPDARVEEEIYPRAEMMQNLLGEVNDRVSALERIEAWRDEHTSAAAQAGLAELLERESLAWETTHAALEHWWRSGEPRRLGEQMRRLVEEAG